MSRPEIDRYSLTWRSLAVWTEAQIEEARAILETPGLDPRDTEFQRGRIALARELLRLSDADPPPEPADPGGFGLGPGI